MKIFIDGIPANREMLPRMSERRVAEIFSVSVDVGRIDPKSIIKIDVKEGQKIKIEKVHKFEAHRFGNHKFHFYFKNS